MDFKICGTREGITAFQLDLKIHGLPMSIAKEAIAQNKVSRDAILDIMFKTMPATRAELKSCAPRTHRIKIPADKIGALIGPGGKNIKRITEYTGCQPASPPARLPACPPARLPASRAPWSMGQMGHECRVSVIAFNGLNGSWPIKVESVMGQMGHDLLIRNLRLRGPNGVGMGQMGQWVMTFFLTPAFAGASPAV
jgi:hypothetical protein